MATHSLESPPTGLLETQPESKSEPFSEATPWNVPPDSPGGICANAEHECRNLPTSLCPDCKVWVCCFSGCENTMCSKHKRVCRKQLNFSLEPVHDIVSYDLKDANYFQAKPKQPRSADRTNILLCIKRTGDHIEAPHRPKPEQPRRRQQKQQQQQQQQQQQPQQKRGVGANRKTMLRKPSYVSDADWTGFSDNKKRNYAHAGRIEETSDGMIALEDCDKCPPGKAECMVYTDAARERYHGVKGGFACSRCRRMQLACSFATEATQKAAASAPPTYDELTAENSALRAELAAEKAKTARLQMQLDGS